MEVLPTTYTNGDTLIIAYHDVPRWSGAGTYTFEIIIRRDGSITFQYQSLTGTRTSATVGIQNADRTDGLQVVYNASYLHENLAILFSNDVLPMVE